MLRRKNLKAILAGGTCALALATAGMAAAQTRDYDVPAGDLMAALDAYARQSGVQIIYKIADVTGVKSGGAQGALSDDEALNQLLEGTNFEVSRDPSGAIAIALEGRRGPQFASAAAEDAEGTVEALIVTAQKREEDIQDVPIAISAFTQEQLERSQVAGGPDLITQVPNMTFTKTNFTSYSIQIRGIGTQAISATTDNAVAVAFNNTPFIRNRFFEQEFYDLQRVEVLRGPQGTLYGRNATAGVVNLISQKPKLSTFEAKLSGDIANYNSSRIEGMINLPLVEDAVGLRLAGAWTKREGYSTNQMTGAPIDGRNLWSTRLSLAIEPTDSFRADLIWEHFEEDDDRLRSGKQLCTRHEPTEIAGVPFPGYGSGGPDFNHPIRTYNQGCVAGSLYSPDAFQAPSGYSLPYFGPLIRVNLPAFGNVDPYLSTTQSRDLRVIESSIEPKYRAKTDLAELQISFDLTDELTLTSETAYADDFVWSTQDFNRFTTRPGVFHPYYESTSPYGHFNNRPGLLQDGFFCDPQLGCSDRVLAADLATAQSQHFSQELRLGSDFDGPFNFSLGANYLRYDTEDKYYVFVNTLTLWAAVTPGSILSFNDMPPWDPTTSDNSGCFRYGPMQSDLNIVRSVTGCKYIEPNSIENIQDLGHNYFLSKNPYKLISYAVFGEAYYNLAENLKLTAGLRWTVDKKEAPRVPSQLYVQNAVGLQVAEVIEQEWREPTGRLTLDWKPDLGFTDETLLYASYAHGYKAGGANPPTAHPTIYCPACAIVSSQELIAEQAAFPRTFEPEFIDAYEIGAKNTLLDGRVTLNTAAFYYDYENYQISEIVERAAFNHNYDAKVWGLEIEADWRPLENLRLGFKGGYQNTEIAEGERALDLMDRTAGNPNWVVARPFPTIPSNCVIPTYIATTLGTQIRVPGTGIQGPCEDAYRNGIDPVTGKAYVPNPTSWVTSYGGPSRPDIWTGYPGFDPLAGQPGQHAYTGQNTFNGVDYGPAPNGGQGFFKDLSGNELPNAPHFTATITADYTVPLPNDWLATLHTDLYYQSEAWTRIFNTEGYDKLKAYTNVNLAAIFTNEERGWKVMAYVKNVFDKDNITGAFLNSDDTGLTTNVFLVEPRLYGLRVTKGWNGEPIFGLGDPTRPPSLWVELGGGVQRHDAPNEQIRPAFFDAFADALDPGQIQQGELDWGQNGSVRLTYSRPETIWRASAGVRWGKTGTSNRAYAEEREAKSCAVFDGTYYGRPTCDPEQPWYLGGGVYAHHYPINWSRETIGTREDFQMIDFMVGVEVGLGGLKSSKVDGGIGYASFDSEESMTVDGIPDWRVPSLYFLFLNSQHERYDMEVEVGRSFKGTGPMLSWDAAQEMLDFGERGSLDVDWTVKGGVLFGKQQTRLQGQYTERYFNQRLSNFGRYNLPLPTTMTTVTLEEDRSDDVTVPMLDLSLGLSYEVGRFKVGAGYRWERYFDVLDVGFEEAETGDRTMDGPYFKVSLGFGG